MALLDCFNPLVMQSAPHICCDWSGRQTARVRRERRSAFGETVSLMSPDLAWIWLYLCYQNSTRYHLEIGEITKDHLATIMALNIAVVVRCPSIDGVGRQWDFALQFWNLGQIHHRPFWSRNNKKGWFIQCSLPQHFNCVKPGRSQRSTYRQSWFQPLSTTWMIPSYHLRSGGKIAIWSTPSIAIWPFLTLPPSEPDGHSRSHQALEEAKVPFTATNLRSNCDRLVRLLQFHRIETLKIF